MLLLRPVVVAATLLDQDSTVSYGRGDCRRSCDHALARSTSHDAESRAKCCASLQVFRQEVQERTCCKGGRFFGDFFRKARRYRDVPAGRAIGKARLPLVVFCLLRLEKELLCLDFGQTATTLRTVYAYRCQIVQRQWTPDAVINLSSMLKCWCRKCRVQAAVAFAKRILWPARCATADVSRTVQDPSVRFVLVSFLR